MLPNKHTHTRSLTTAHRQWSQSWKRKRDRYRPAHRPMDYVVQLPPLPVKQQQQVVVHRCTSLTWLWIVCQTPLKYRDILRIDSFTFNSLRPRNVFGCFGLRFTWFMFPPTFVYQPIEQVTLKYLSPFVIEYNPPPLAISHWTRTLIQLCSLLCVCVCVCAWALDVVTQ